MLSQVTYIWIDGALPTHQLRSKTRIIKHPEGPITLQDFPQWSFDGSSTNQAPGHDSDLILMPVNFVKDPILGEKNYLLMCEVMNGDGSPHPTNKRAKLRELMKRYGDQHEPWIGFEQEYTLFQGPRPLGWPEHGFPRPQGPFYCGVGADEVFGRELVEEHTQACIDAGIMIFGTNAEVMPGQWEYQIGPRGIEGEAADPITISDHLWIARWLMQRLGEHYGITVSLHPKPVHGDWNGAGKHSNFSVKSMRDKRTGSEAIKKAVFALENSHHDHIGHYGHALEERLTGHHETAHIGKFSHGIGHRGSSVRIPRPVAEKGYGYIEDRRPGANANPYEVSAKLVETICSALNDFTSNANAKLVSSAK